MGFARTLLVGVTAGAAIVSSQLTLDRDEPWDLQQEGGGAVNVASLRMETPADCTELDSMIQGIAERLVEQGPISDVITLDGVGLAAEAGTSGAATAERASGAAPLTGAPVAAAAEDAGGDGTVIGTNVQEQGVDETDVIKTDGRTIWVLREGKLVSVDAQSLEQLDRLGWRNRHPYDMLLADDRLILFENGWREPERKERRDGSARDLIAPYDYGSSLLRITVVDASDPSALDVVSVVEVEGSLVAARLIDGVARVVTTDSPHMAWPMPMPMVDGAEPATPRVTPEVGVEDVLPSIEVIEDGDRRDIEIPCGSTFVAPRAETLGSTTVFSLDPMDPEPKGSATTLAGAGTVYANTESLYVARNNWNRRGIERTEIHRFDISDADDIEYRSVGTVPGYLLNQFSMSEHEGLLRVATTSRGGRRVSESQVTILRERGDSLDKIGQVGGLGLDEQIFAVRFIGELGYVVTFRQIDPLYVLDLSDPTSPSVAGELKIPGYSAYLHPVAEGFLVGVGQDADNQGRTRGVQVSLFDVRDPANPKRVSILKELGDYSAVEHDHRAFQFIPDRNLVVVPASTWEYTERGGQQERPEPDAPEGEGSSGSEGSAGEAPEIIEVPPLDDDDAPTEDQPADDREGSQVEEPGTSTTTPSYIESELKAYAYLIEVTPDGLREIGRISHRKLLRQSSGNLYRTGEMQRSIAIGDSLFTLSDAGLVATDMDRLENLAALPW